MIGGWRDGYPNPPLRLYQALQVPKKVLIGPWNHAVPDVAVPGPRIDYLHEVVRWLDHWCKGRSPRGSWTSLRSSLYVQHYEKPVVDRLEAAGEWRGRELTGRRRARASARSTWTPADVLGDATVTTAADDFEYVPTVGVTGRPLVGRPPVRPSGRPAPRRGVSRSSTAPPPLEEDVYVIGRPRAVLHVSSTATVIGFAASLSDVAPGRHLASRRQGDAERDAAQLAHRSRAADARERSTSSRSRSTRRPGSSPGGTGSGSRSRAPTGRTSGRLRSRRRTPSTAAPARPSRLVLPTVPPQGSATPPAFLPSPKSLARHSDRTDPPVWQVVHDVLAGRSQVRIEETADERIDETTVVRREYSLVADVHPDRPASASARGRHTSRITRPNSVMEGSSDVLIQGDGDPFPRHDRPRAARERHAAPFRALGGVGAQGPALTVGSRPGASCPTDYQASENTSRGRASPTL